MQPCHDLHLHTSLSACCQLNDRTPASVIALAESMGVSTIGFADHIWANPGISPSEWYRPQNEEQISRLRSQLAEVSTPLRVLVGCEADMIAPGKFGIVPEFARTLDYVLLSCSHFHMKEFVAQPPTDAPSDLARQMLDFFRSGVASGLATSIAHPLFPFGSRDKFAQAISSISDAELEDAFGLASEHGTALEITPVFIPPEIDPPFSIDTPVRFLSIARNMGCKFTFGTDAHDPAGQRRLPELAMVADMAGIHDEDVLNISSR